MFNAPEAFEKIPDIAKIYEINDKQIGDLENAVTQLDDDIFFETMSEERIKRFENILGIVALDNMSIEDRRLKVHMKVLEKLPYSYRVIAKKLDALVGNAYTMKVENNVFRFTCSVIDKTLLDYILDMFEEIVPLNIHIIPTNLLQRTIGTEIYIHSAIIKSVERTISTEE